MHELQFFLRYQNSIKLLQVAMKIHHTHISLYWRSFDLIMCLTKLLRAGSYTDQYDSVCISQLFNLIFIQHCTPFSIKKHGAV